MTTYTDPTAIAISRLVSRSGQLSARQIDADVPAGRTTVLLPLAYQSLPADLSEVWLIVTPKGGHIDFDGAPVNSGPPSTAYRAVPEGDFTLSPDPATGTFAYAKFAVSPFSGGESLTLWIDHRSGN